MTTQFKGCITELEVARSFLEMGYIVSRPLIDTRYDYIVEIKGKLYTIQVKSAQVDENETFLKFKTCNTHTNTQGTINKNYKNDNVDYFATYYKNKCYIVPVSECGSRSKTLRFTSPNKNQVKNINFAKDYELEKIFPND